MSADSDEYQAYARQGEGRQALLALLGRRSLPNTDRARLQRLVEQPMLSEQDIASLILAHATPGIRRAA